MPNWCQNRLFVEGPEAEVERFVIANKHADYHKHEDNGRLMLSFAAAVPMPESEADNWYDWNCSNWGCKWDASDVSFDDDPSEYGEWSEEGHMIGVYRFHSPWAPPLEWFYQIAPKWPELSLRLYYAELGMGFCGVATSIDGEPSNSEELDLNDIVRMNFGNYA